MKEFAALVIVMVLVIFLVGSCVEKSEPNLNDRFAMVDNFLP